MIDRPMMMLKCVFLLSFYIFLCWAGLGTRDVWTMSQRSSPLATSRFYVMRDEQGVYSEGSSAFPASQTSAVLLAGLGVVTDALEWSGVALASLFHQPHATALFVVDGIATTFPSLSKKSFSVDQSGLTGETAADVAAIVGETSAAEYLDAAYDGKAFSIAVSGDEEVAALSNGENAFINSEHMSAIASSISEQLVLSKYGVLDIAQKLDVTDGVDAAFLVELVAMKQAVNDVKTTGVEKDGIPDTYTFIFSSLRALEGKYGADSEVMKFCLEAVKGCIDEITSELLGLYEGKMLVQALVLQWKEIPGYTQELSQAYDILQAHLSHKVTREWFVNHLPQTFTLQGVSDDEKLSLCNQLHRLLQEDVFQVECGGGGRRNRVLRSNGVGASSGGVPSNVSQGRSENFTAIFLMSFFVVLVIGLALYAFSWGIWNMDPGRDSIIYRTVPDTSEGVQMH